VTPIIIPMLTSRNSPTAGLGYLIGFAACFIFVVSMWGVRPLVLPRHGKWVNGEYYVGNVRCGEIQNFEGWSSYSYPPMWVGLGDFKVFRDQQSAKKAVEWSCQ
jgi:hypothetical protein